MTNLTGSLKARSIELANKIADLVEITIDPEMIKDLVNDFYMKGMEEMEIKFNMNFIPNQRRMQELNFSLSESLQKLNDDVQNQVKRTIADGIINYKSTSLIAKELRPLFDNSRVRAEMIARTESNRAYNMSHVDSIRQTDLKVKKFVSVVLDSRTSPICRHMNATYGTEEKAIALDRKFKYDGKEWDIPPFHPNCRTRVLFTEEGA